MNIKEVICLSLAVVFLVVGVWESIYIGFANAYPIFMLMFTMLCMFGYIRINKSVQNNANNTQNNSKPLKKKK